MNLSITKRFFISLFLTFPLLVEMILMPLGWSLPGHNLIAFLLTTLIMLLSAQPFWRSAWSASKKHHANMDTLVAVGTATAYFYSIYAMLFHQPVYFESAAVVTTFVLLGQVFEERMRKQAANATEKLLKLQAKSALVWRAGQYITLPLAEIQINDQVKVLPGEKVPIDGVVIDGHSSIDESSITGESLPIEKQVDDPVIGATINTNGTLIIKVTKTQNETMLQQIVDVVKKAQVSRAPIQKLTDKVSDVFVPIVLIIAIITFLAWYLALHLPVGQSLSYSVAVIVIACPCALGLATPTALMVGTGRSAKMGILIKNGDVLEIAENIKTVVFDKTGTITQGQPLVTDVFGSNKNSIIQLAASLEQLSEHPLAKAIFNAGHDAKITTLPVNNFQSLTGIGAQGMIQDHSIVLGNNQILSSDTKISNDFIQKTVQLEAEAKTIVYLSVDAVVIGIIAIQDIPKTSSKAAIAMLKSRGIKTVMLTGDNQGVAKNIGQSVGIDQVIANVLPTEKAETIIQLQKSGTVAFVGDGINDAPALTTADLGIAMGSGSDIAIDSGDIVLVKNDLQDVTRAIEISQKTFHKIKANLFWAFIYNIIGIPIAAGVFTNSGLTLSPELAGLAMAFSSISVVFNSLLLNETRIQ
ncbi:copper-translocating P-type ATPase [Weissella coleopterorum]|uniref:P-type Cu(+) transporter n=1 Tax=Weissella coleopterorum TaxID=2714949 RepID=A0A6G8B0A0_9LACO|nr:copper-translocating P-type ATPase [Weissella coleopterorum]QIL50738.1 copper-translocating P-type ATPase [Weissella coleopterorum]